MDDGYRELPNLEALAEDQVWYLHLYCGGSYVGQMRFIDADTNLQQILDMANKTADGRLPGDRPIAFKETNPPRSSQPQAKKSKGNSGVAQSQPTRVTRSKKMSGDAAHSSSQP